MNRTRVNSIIVFSFIAVTVLFYWKIFLTQQYSLLTGVEPVNQTYSWLSFEVSSIRHGHLPSWDPFAFSGHSFVGEMQTAVYYPVHWLLALAPLNKNGLIPVNLFHLLFGFNHVLAALFFYWLARELAFDRYVSFVAGMCFAFGQFVGRVEWPHILESAIWTPVIFAALLRAQRSQGLMKAANVALASLGLGLSILAGGLHIVIMQVILIVSAGAYVAYRKRGADGHLPVQSWMPAGLLVCAILCGGAAVGAVQLLPSHEYAERSIRFLSGTTWPSNQRIPYELLQDQVAPQEVESILFPTMFDSRYFSGEVWSPYIGVFPLALAIIAIWLKSKETWVRYFAVVGIASQIYTMGAFTGLHRLAYAVVPFIWMAREATRFTFLTQFAGCVLMAYGLDALRRSRFDDAMWRPVRALLKWIMIAVSVALLVPIFYTRIDLGAWIALSLGLILATCAILFRISRKEPSRAVWQFIAVFIFFDLLSFSWTGLPKDSKSGNFAATLSSTSKVCNFLRSQPGPFRVSVDSSPPVNIADACRVPALGGGGVTFLDTYGRLLETPEILNAQYHLKTAAAQDAGAIYQDASWKVYVDKRAYPRAWIVHDVAQQASSPNPDLHQTAVFRNAPSVSVEPQLPGDKEQVTWQKYDGDELALSTDLRSKGLIVMSENYYPGWSATVNGTEAQIWSVDGGLRGIALPKGKDTVAMYYRPWSVRVGAVLTLLATFLCTGIFIAALRSKTRRSTNT